MSNKCSLIVWDRDFGSSIRKVIAARLADHADEEGRGIWPSVERIAAQCNTSCRTVQRTLAAFVDEGVLRIISEGGRGPGSTRRYDFDMTILQALPLAVWGADAKGDTDDAKGDTDDIKGCHGVTQTTIEPPIEPSEREGAGERGQRQEAEPASPADDGEADPRTLMKRVKALEVGLKRNPWPKVLSSSTDWSLRQFTKLSPEERRLAEERRDAYLAACPKDRDGNPKAVPLGVYLRDRKFLDVEAIVPRVAAKAEVIAVAPFGPVWAALREMAFIKGPVSVEMPVGRREAMQRTFEALGRASASRAHAYIAGKGVRIGENGALIFPDDFEQAEYRRMVRDGGYPEVNRLHELAGNRERGQAEGRFAALADLCEPVPVGSALFEEWRRHDHEANRPFVPNPGSMPVVYFPKGGPAGLVEFERAARVALAMERGDEYAA
ncbi:helix-turn-helix domain-containing protein [Sinorhizobium sp. BG8]|uniref:helix-turn-helix domain-containing protein n=1 Tax=Sinorhizobium sp. BG8 TaxID=2613773 RepID=UPI00193CA6DC|nr:helix-turn-helix domain-containing protein [Sinorhizobium sp. BG8]QRM55133.1 helix-turn-helix domain-containing protein [Sinorhizobium sp. BG8]